MSWEEVILRGFEYCAWMLSFGLIGGFMIWLTFNSDLETFGLIFGTIFIIIGMTGMMFKIIADGVGYALYHHSNNLSQANVKSDSNAYSQNPSDTQFERLPQHNYDQLFYQYTRICNRLFSKLKVDAQRNMSNQSEFEENLLSRGFEDPFSLSTDEKKRYVSMVNLALENLTKEDISLFAQSAEFEVYRLVTKHFLQK